MNSKITKLVATIGGEDYELIPSTDCSQCSFRKNGRGCNCDDCPEFNDYAIASDIDVVFRKITGHKMEYTVTIVKILGWERDSESIDSDASSMAADSICRYAREVKEKLEDCTFKPLGLPFTTTFVSDHEWSEESVKRAALEDYIACYCTADYVVPTDCEITVKEREV